MFITDMLEHSDNTPLLVNWKNTWAKSQSQQTKVKLLSFLETGGKEEAEVLEFRSSHVLQRGNQVKCQELRKRQQP